MTAAQVKIIRYVKIGGVRGLLNKGDRSVVGCLASLAHIAGS
jgi:hypothetical protein